MKPVLFLDFDFTLFDGARFWASFGEAPEIALRALLEKKIPSPDYSVFLYSDTVDFLQRVREKFMLVILTFETFTDFQTEKIRGSGVTALVDDVVITGGMKSVAAKEWLVAHHIPSSNAAFLDDRLEHIVDMRMHIPEIFSVYFKRPGVEHDNGNPLSTAHPKDDDLPAIPPDAFATSLDEFVLLAEKHWEEEANKR